MCVRLLLSVLVGISVSAVPGLGQGLPQFRDSVVVTATGEEHPLDEIAAAVTVLEREDLERTGSAALSDALRRVPGATVLRSGLDTGVTSLFLRGSNSSHTLVLLDGVRLNSPYFGGYDFGLPLVGTLDRVEVVRGPYSALYGGDAMGGVVQLMTRPPEGSSWGALVEGGGGGWRRLELGGSFEHEGIGVTVALAGREGTGPVENDDFKGRAGLARATWQVGSALQAGVLVHRSDTRTGIPFSGAVATPERTTESDELTLAIPLRWRWDGGATLEIVPSRVEQKLRFRDPDDSFGLVASDTLATSSGMRAVWRQTLSGHRLSVGGEWRQDLVDDGSNFGVNLDGRTLTTGAVFVQDAFTLGRRLDVLLGGRWDRAHAWGSRFSPRATVAWRQDSWRVWSSFGEAFRAPALGELYYPFAGNPDLQPERSRSAEVGAAVDLPGGRSQLQLVAFSNRARDLVEFDFASYQFDNVSRSRQQGWEGALVVNLGKGVLHASATWLETEDGDGRRLLRRPRWSGSLALHRPLWALITEASVVWVGSRPDLDPITFGRVDHPSFVTANAAVTIPLGGVFAVRVRAENLADRGYEEVRGYPAPGRRFMVGMLASNP